VTKIADLEEIRIRHLSQSDEAADLALDAVEEA
jgi:hypothetical protein